MVNGGVAASATYHYRITAVTGTDKSSYSNAPNATTASIPPITYNTEKVDALAQSIIYKTSTTDPISIINKANSLLYTYTDEQWLATVPVQGPRSHDTRETWVWNSRTPNHAGAA